jgi:putative SOS response-associated peptidase YedK
MEGHGRRKSSHTGSCRRTAGCSRSPAYGNPGADRIESFSIIVTEGNELAREIHDRMPVVLDPEHHDARLATESTNAKALLRPYPANRMRMYAVSKRVNTPKNDNAELVAPLQVPAWG